MAKGDGEHPGAPPTVTAAGTLWSALVRFDDGLRKQYEDGLGKASDATARIRQAYYKNVTSKQLNWDRLFVKDPAKGGRARPPLQPGQPTAVALPIPDAG